MKLGLPSKEMADIVVIGADGVSASRSRIRKKMNLTSDVNLVEYLGSIN
ncbi:LuxR C-terminal-related transcriptional regulator [Saccharicrinis aurantiacus]|nr:LuxR C-terminal-related transcriptional regulator [Saccharicrinis aurantiacus]